MQVTRLTEALAASLDAERAMRLEDDGVDIATLPASEQPDFYRQNIALLGVMRQIVAANAK